MSDYEIETLVTVDGHGQIVIPKAVRKKAGISKGEKLVLLTSQKEGEPCNIFLIKAGNLVKNASSAVLDASEISTKRVYIKEVFQNGFRFI